MRFSAAWSARTPPLAISASGSRIAVIALLFLIVVSRI
jgi:hypothetical protein